MQEKNTEFIPMKILNITEKKGEKKASASMAISMKQNKYDRERKLTI